jgi:hypothetical protein
MRSKRLTPLFPPELTTSPSDNLDLLPHVASGATDQAVSDVVIDAGIEDGPDDTSAAATEDAPAGTAEVASAEGAPDDVALNDAHPEADNHDDRSPSTLPATARVRTFFAVALQLGRAFAPLVDLVKAVYAGDPFGLQRAAQAIAHAVLHGARDRGKGPMVRCAIDQQRRTEPLTRLRPSRPGRTPQAIAARARRRAKGDKVTA